MAWGYEKCFTIEHDNTLKRRIDCKDCCYYESDDKSCMKRPLYLPVDGYNSWRTCDYFELDSSTSHYEEKRMQLASVLQRKTNSVKKNETSGKKVETKKSVSVIKNQKSKALVTKSASGNSTSSKRSGYRVFAFEIKPKGKKLKYEYVEIVIATGGKRQIQVAFDDEMKIAYINKKVYTQEAIENVRKQLK